MIQAAPRDTDRRDSIDGASARLSARRAPQAEIWLLVLLPVLVHAPALLGFVHANPSLICSGVARPQPLSVFGSQYIDGNVGGLVQAQGSLAARDWLHGILPWWNPYSGAGLPLAASMQPGAFFLPFVLLLNAGDGVMYMKIVLQVLAGLATYAALRERGLGGLAACVGGLLFEMNGAFAWFGDAPIMPIAFLPLLIWGIEKTRADLGARPDSLIGRPRASSSAKFGPALVALAVAFSVVAGFPQTAFLDGLLAGVWTLDAICRIAAGSGWRSVFAFVARLTAGLLCGVLLAVPVILPFISYLRVADLGLHNLSVLGIVTARQIPALALPYLFGPIYGDLQAKDWSQAGGYVGSSVLLLALAAIARPAGEKMLRLGLAAWVLVCLAVACGQAQLDGLRLMLPVLKDVTFCRYIMPSIDYAAIALAAFAVDDWARGAWNFQGARTRLAAIITLWALGILICVWYAWPRVRLDWPTLGDWMIGSVMLAAVSATACAVLLIGNPSRRRGGAWVTVLSLEAALLSLPPVLAAPRAAVLDMAPVDYLRANIGLGRVFAMGGQLVENYGAQLGIASIDYIDLPVSEAWARYVHEHIDPFTGSEYLGEGFGNGPLLAQDLLERHTALEEAGVSEALVSATDDPLADADPTIFKRVFADGKARIYSLPHARPYWQASDDSCRLQPEGRDRLVAICDKPAALIRRELLFGDWQARVNGHHARIAPFDTVFQQIELPAGTSHIRFRYVPPDANLIAVLFAIGVLGLAWLSGAPDVWRRRGNMRVA